MTVLDADGHLLESRKLGTEKWELLEFFGKVAKPAALAVEATFNGYYFLNVVEPLGLELHLVHPCVFIRHPWCAIVAGSGLIHIGGDPGGTQICRHLEIEIGERRKSTIFAAVARRRGASPPPA